MQVILLEKVTNLGNLGETVAVKPGYGRNFLIPQGKALPATARNVEVFEQRRAELQAKADATFGAATARAEKAEGLELQIAHRAGEEGKLYGSVTTSEIAKASTDAGVELGKNEIDLIDGPIRYTGEHRVLLHFHADVQVILTIKVVAESSV